MKAAPADEYTEYTKKSRHGHGKDVVDENNVRQVAGCVPIDPKGGWETDETQKHAAQRETWEEAGIKGTIIRQIGVFEERTAKKNILKAHHWVFEMHITEIAKKFPERKKRERRWFSFEEALKATQEHPYIQDAIQKSSLNPQSSLNPKSIDGKLGVSKLKSSSFISHFKSFFF